MQQAPQLEFLPVGHPEASILTMDWAAKQRDSIKPQLRIITTTEVAELPAQEDQQHRLYLGGRTSHRVSTPLLLRLLLLGYATSRILVIAMQR